MAKNLLHTTTLRDREIIPARLAVVIPAKVLFAALRETKLISSRAEFVSAYAKYEGQQLLLDDECALHVEYLDDGEAPSTKTKAKKKPLATTPTGPEAQL